MPLSAVRCSLLLLLLLGGLPTAAVAAAEEEGRVAWPKREFPSGPFEGVCGHWSERLPRVRLPVEEEEGQLLEAELLQVSVVFRHGARSLWKPMGCWAPQAGAAAQHPAFDCTGLPMKMAAGPGMPRTLVKHYDLPGGCGVGSLLPEANEQFRAAAAALNGSYGEVPWWRTLDPERSDGGGVFLYSCDNDRNLGSMDMMVSHLFPANLRATQAPGAALRVNVRPPNEDPFEIRGNVPVPDQETLIEAAPRFQDFSQKWRQAANVTWTTDLFDCILTARCTGDPLPAAISEELAEEALRWGFLQNTAAVRLTDVTSVLVAGALRNLTMKFQEATRVEASASTAASAAPLRLLLWSTHDSTIMYMLEALSAWEEIWPPYASMLNFELYRSKQRGALQPSSPFFVRLVHDGKPLRMKACGGGKVICPLDDFLALVRRWCEAAEGREAALNLASGPQAVQAAEDSSGSGRAWRWWRCCYLSGAFLAAGGVAGLFLRKAIKTGSNGHEARSKLTPFLGDGDA